NFVNVPVSEYTVISSGTDNCEGETVTLEYDFEDHGGVASAGRVLVGDDIVDNERNGENLRLAGAPSFGNILYLDCNSQSDKTLKVENSGKAEASSPVLVVAKKYPALKY
ncbi:hypothetical protein BgiBS90_018574, partial [Biomphalaria glabrata]